MWAFDRKAACLRLVALIITLAAAGCAGMPKVATVSGTQGPGETPVILPGSATVTSVPAAVESHAAESTTAPQAVSSATLEATGSTPAATPGMAAASTPAEQGGAQGGVLYRDDFTDTGSGWPDNVQFGNYYVGYHEPDHYHVDIHVPHDRAVVAVPKHTFTDFTMETKVMAEPNNTAKTGDFRYGLVFRRSGNQFYAFVVSPRTKNWAVLKSSADGLKVLRQGANAPTQGLTADDTLRIDVKGSSFFFHLNGQLLGTANDPEYTTGEAGFYVETFDSPRIHAHWGTTTVREVELPQATCTVVVAALNVRSGPNLRASLIAGARQGAQLEPLGRDGSGSWLKVRVTASGVVGWVSALPPYVSCTIATSDLAVTTP